MSKLLFFYKFRTWNRISIFGLQFEEIMWEILVFLEILENRLEILDFV
jgi:hypothetical protein